ncbi:MAG: tetratricopeptide repeat protein [Dehalococcoidia bacterium]|jgi:tetratricopeptide (TPR) repeat protein
MKKWFETHLEGALWLVWLGGGALLGGLIAAILKLETVESGLSLMGWWLIILLSVGYLATLIKVCNWVLEEKAQDRSIMWAFLIALIGGIFPIIVALFGRNNTIIKVSGKAESADDFEVRRLVEREKDQPLSIGQSSERALRLAKEHFNRALEHEGRGEREKAILEYAKAIEFDNRYAMAYYNRGLLLTLTGKKARAKADLQKVISLSEGAELADMATRSLKELEAYEIGK